MTKENSYINPGRSTGIISLSEAERIEPGFIKDRPEHDYWRLGIRFRDGTHIKMPFGTEWEAVSRFGAVRSVVVTDSEGNPLYDAIKDDRAPSVNIVAWGKDKKTGDIKIGILNQIRQHADNEYDDSDDPLAFAQLPAGFIDEIDDNGKKRLENIEETTKRELHEEMGVTKVLNITQPSYPQEYPLPTHVGSSTEIIFAEVDLDSIEESTHHTVEDEGILSAEFINLDQLLKDIKNGKTDRGYARMSVTNSLILLYLSHLTAIQNSFKNERMVEKMKHKILDPEGYLDACLEKSAELYPDRKELNERKVKDYKNRHFDK